MDLENLSLDLNALCRAESVIGPLPALLDNPSGALSFKILRALVWAGLPPAAGVKLDEIDELLGDTPPGTLGEVIAAAILKNVTGEISPEVLADCKKIERGLGLEAQLAGKRFRFNFKALALAEESLGPLVPLSEDPPRAAAFSTIRTLIQTSSVEPMTTAEAGEFVEKTGFGAAAAFIWALLRATFPESSAEAPGKPKAA